MATEPNTKVLVGPSNKGDEPRRLTSAERKAMEPRVAAFNRFLADFGFSAAQHLVEGVVAQGNTPTMRFPRSGVGLVLSRREGKARVMRKNELLQELDVFGPGPSFQKGWCLADEKLLLFTWHIDEPEGCAFEGDRVGAAMVNLTGK